MKQPSTLTIEKCSNDLASSSEDTIHLSIRVSISPGSDDMCVACHKKDSIMQGHIMHMSLLDETKYSRLSYQNTTLVQLVHIHVYHEFMRNQELTLFS